MNTRACALGAGQVAQGDRAGDLGVAGFLAILILSGAALAAGTSRAAAWEQRQSWDWGQHRTSVTGDDPPRPVVEPRRPLEHWDDPAAPSRFAQDR